MGLTLVRQQIRDDVRWKTPRPSCINNVDTVGSSLHSAPDHHRLCGNLA